MRNTLLILLAAPVLYACSPIGTTIGNNCREQVIWQIDRGVSDNAYDYPLYVDEAKLVSVRYSYEETASGSSTAQAFNPVIRNPNTGEELEVGPEIDWTYAKFYHFHADKIYFGFPEADGMQILYLENMTSLPSLDFNMEAAVGKWAYGSDPGSDTVRIYNLETGAVSLPGLQQYYTEFLRQIGHIDDEPYYFEVLSPDTTPVLNRVHLDSWQKTQLPLDKLADRIFIDQIIHQEDLILVNFKDAALSSPTEYTHNELVAYNALTLDSLWRISLMGLPIQYFVNSLGKAGNEALLFLHNGGYLLALDRQTGALIWNWETDEGFAPLETHKQEMMAGQHRLMMADGDIICFHDIANTDYYIYDPNKDVLYIGGVRYRAIKTE